MADSEKGNGSATRSGREKLRKLRALGVSPRALDRLEGLLDQREQLASVYQVEEDAGASPAPADVLPAPPLARAALTTPLDREVAALDAALAEAEAGNG